MGAHGEVDDAKHVPGIGVAAVYSVAEDWHIGEAGVRHYEQLMHRAGKAFEHDFRLIGNGIEKQHFRAHLVDRDHPARVFSAGHRYPRSTRMPEYQMADLSAKAMLHRKVAGR